MAGLVTWDSNNQPTVWATINTTLGALINSGARVTDQNGNPVTVVSFIPGVGIVPNGTPGSGYLANGCPLNVWFGQGWVAGQQAALAPFNITCALSPGSSASPSAAIAAPSSGAGVNPGTPIQGQTTPFGVSYTSGSAVNSATAAAIAPSLSPGTPGAVPTGEVTGQTPSIAGPAIIYRFILYDPTAKVYHTGANYSGCSQVNTALCDPQDFPTLQAAVAYAQARGETPYIANSAAEVWSIIAGTTAINPAQIYSGMSSSIPTWAWIAAGLGLFFFLKK